MFCPQCGRRNDDSMPTCLDCGAELPAAKTFKSKFQPEPVTVTTQQDNPVDETDEYYRAFIGPNNQGYYLRYFEEFDREGKTSPTWHWPAFLVTFYWFLYRKMWLNALIYFLLPYIFAFFLGIAAAVAGDSAQLFLGFAYILFFIGIWVVPPMYANALYYRHCNKKIEQARATTRDFQRQLGELSAKGGTSSVVLIFVLIFVFVAVIGILAAIAIPAYQDFNIRARMSQAESLGNQAAHAVADYYSQHEQFPDSLQDAGVNIAPTQGVKSIAVDSTSGIVTVMLTGNSQIEGHALQWTPVENQNGQMTWECHTDIKDRYLSPQCRQKK